MANLFIIGQEVKQVVPVIQGTIKEKKFIENDICYLVMYTDGAGESHERWFKEAELTGVVA